MNTSSQVLETFVPVYDAIPDTWEDAKPFIVEQLKSISNAVNIREIGWFLDEELISGKLFIPSSTNNTGEQQEFRTVLRKIVDVSPLVAGVNTFAHGITIDSNFTLIDLWVAATDSVAFTSQVITDDNVTLDSTNVNINSPGAFDRAFCVIEYLQEI